MPGNVETGTTISQLDNNWPLADDPINEGDDHIRLIKSVLKTQFPGSGGQGFTEAVLPTAKEINTLVGIDTTQTLQEQINGIEGNTNLSAPPGTILFFFNAAPPAGWDLVPDNNDSMLRTNGIAGGGFGGTDSPGSFDVQHSHTTGGHALTTAEMPNHAHAMFANVDNNVDLSTVFESVATNFDAGTSGANTYRMKSGGGTTPSLGATSTNGSSSGPGDAHTHGPTGTYSNSFNPRYVYVVMGSKV